MLFSRPQFVQQPTATVGALGQQAQDAATMASAMWRMIEYRSTTTATYGLIYPGYGPEMPKTPLHRNAGTPVGLRRCLGGMATQHLIKLIPHD